MKNNYVKNSLKSAMAAVLMLAIGTANAQTTDATNANTTQANKAGEVIKLIDNKGTIKYLQSNNGITTITSTAANNKTTTTWQLGGTLVDATTITTSATGTFTIDGEEFSLENIATTADPTAKATATSAVSDGTGSGYTILVRNEATGNVEKLLATDLVSGIRVQHLQGTNNDTNGDATGNVAIAVEGLPALTEGTTFAKLFVFRNGIKLRSATDFVATAGVVTITYNATELPMYTGDVIEVQYIK